MVEFFSEEMKKVLQQNGVVLAYVFGSAARGEATILSDLDVGVLVDKTIPPREYHPSRMRLLEQLSDVMEGKPLDVAILNNASPLLVQLVVTRGRAVYCQDENLRTEFEVRALQKFDDAYYLRKTYYSYLEERVRNSALGEIYEG